MNNEDKNLLNYLHALGINSQQELNSFFRNRLTKSFENEVKSLDPQPVNEYALALYTLELKLADNLIPDAQEFSQIAKENHDKNLRQ